MNAPGVRATVVLVVVFALGAFAGAAFERHHRTAPAAGVSVISTHAEAMSELREILELDEAQTAQIHALLSENQVVVQRMWEQLRPEVQQAMTRVHEQVAAVLRPDQQQRFHEWILEQRRLAGESVPAH